MRVTVINNQKKENYFPFGSIALLILGIFLTFNAEGVLSFGFIFLGSFILLFGIYKFIKYYKIKAQFHYDDSTIMMSAVTSTLVGLLTIFLASFISNAIQIITGIWLISSGVMKINESLYFKSNFFNRYLVNLIVGILLIIMGIYSIFADNVVLIFLGIIIIIYALSNIINYFIKVKH